jgi:hypothetical protein
MKGSKANGEYNSNYVFTFRLGERLQTIPEKKVNKKSTFVKFHDFLEMVVEISFLLLKSCKDSEDSS